MDSIDEKIIDIFIEAKKTINVNFFTLSKNKFLPLVWAVIWELADRYKSWSEIKLRQEYIKWASDVINIDISDLKSMTAEELVSFTQSVLSEWHITAINDQIIQTNSIMQQSLLWLQKNIQRKLWEIWRAEVTASLSDIKSLQDAKEKVISIYKNEWITKFRDVAWKEWDIANYADMVVRSESAVANVRWTVNTALEAWYTKFIRRENYSACPICSPHDWEIRDAEKKWQPSPDIYHPRCRWYWEVYIE